MRSKTVALLDFADIVGLQESRRAALGIPSLAVKLPSVGYNVLFGYHVVIVAKSGPALSSTAFQGEWPELFVLMLLRSSLPWVTLNADKSFQVDGLTRKSLTVVAVAPSM